MRSTHAVCSVVDIALKKTGATSSFPRRDPGSLWGWENPRPCLQGTLKGHLTFLRFPINPIRRRTHTKYTVYSIHTGPPLLAKKVRATPFFAIPFTSYKEFHFIRPKFSRSSHCLITTSLTGTGAGAVPGALLFIRAFASFDRSESIVGNPRGPAGAWDDTGVYPGCWNLCGAWPRRTNMIAWRNKGEEQLIRRRNTGEQPKTTNKKPHDIETLVSKPVTLSSFITDLE